MGRALLDINVLIALPLSHAHLQGTLLPRGFFLGLGLGQPGGGDQQAQQQHGGHPRQTPGRRQAIHGQGRQVDQAKAEKETERQQRALE
ncbi:MAG: hypothetical protein ACKOPS_16795 [Cyanobium sp.]